MSQASSSRALDIENPGVSGWRWVTLVTQTSFPSNRMFILHVKETSNIKHHQTRDATISDHMVKSSRNPEKLCHRKTGELDVYVPDGGQEKKAWMNPPSSELGMAQDLPQKNMDL